MKRPRLVAIVVGLQAICAAFFLWDISISVLGLQVVPISWQLYELIEISAVLGLCLGVLVGGLSLWRAWSRQEEAVAQLRLVSGAFMEVVEERFADWGLTPAERDVALFSLKGFSTAEIASLRETSEGTVKAQTNAIYRKAGVSGRAQLLSVFIEDLMQSGSEEAPAQE